MQLLASLKRPEYLFRPAQIIRRVKCELRPPSARYETVRLPWGLPIRVEPKEKLGALILRLGVYDLHACEYISRLIDRGDIAVDAGANIGHMTSLMAMRAGPAGDRVEISVIDTGPGIPAGQREEIFRPFQRRGDSPGGLGLGLAIAKGFTEAMRGMLSVEDTPGGGATFVFSLPSSRP